MAHATATAGRRHKVPGCVLALGGSASIESSGYLIARFTGCLLFVIQLFAHYLLDLNWLPI